MVTGLMTRGDVSMTIETGAGTATGAGKGEGDRLVKEATRRWELSAALHVLCIMLAWVPVVHIHFGLIQRAAHSCHPARSQAAWECEVLVSLLCFVFSAYEFIRHGPCLVGASKLGTLIRW